MRPRFLGRWECAIDEKRRLTLPAPVRKKVLALAGEAGGEDEELIATVGHRGCVLLIPPAVWDEFARSIFQAPVQGNREALLVRGRMARYGAHCKIDASGRITLTEEQMKVAGLERQAIVFGNFTRLEIWNPEQFERHNPPITDVEAHDELIEKYLDQG